MTTTFRFSAGLLPRRGSGRHVLPMPGDQPRPPAPGPVHSRTVFPPPVRLSCRPALGGAGSAAILAAATRNRQVRSQPTRMPHVPKKVGGHRCGGGLRSAVPGRAGTWYQGRSHTEEERPRSAASRGSARTGGTPRRRSTRGPAQGSSSLPPTILRALRLSYAGQRHCISGRVLAPLHILAKLRQTNNQLLRGTAACTCEKI